MTQDAEHGMKVGELFAYTWKSKHKTKTVVAPIERVSETHFWVLNRKFRRDGDKFCEVGGNATGWKTSFPAGYYITREADFDRGSFMDKFRKLAAKVMGEPQ